MKNMKNLIFTSLMMLGVFLPTNMKAYTTSDSLSILDKLYFHLNDDDECNNGNIIKPFSHNTVSVSGKLYTNGEVELTFIYNEAVTVSIKYEDTEVDCTDFIPTEGNRTLTFDLNNYGKGEYEINVSMPDGSVQTANFKY